MKKRFKVLSVLALAGLALCATKPSEARAEMFSGTEVILAGDSYVSSYRQSGAAITYIFDAKDNDSISTRVYSVVYYRNIYTGNGGGYFYDEAVGIDCAEVCVVPPTSKDEISRIDSVHNGTLNGKRLTIYSHDY